MSFTIIVTFVDVLFLPREDEKVMCKRRGINFVRIRLCTDHWHANSLALLIYKVNCTIRPFPAKSCYVLTYFERHISSHYVSTLHKACCLFTLGLVCSPNECMWNQIGRKPRLLFPFNTYISGCNQNVTTCQPLQVSSYINEYDMGLSQDRFWIFW